MGDVWLSPVSITASLLHRVNWIVDVIPLRRAVVWRSCHWSLSHSLDSALTMKLSSVKMESFSTRMCFRKVSSEADRSFSGEAMALDLECGLKERGNKMSFLEQKPENLYDFLVYDGLEEKPEADRSRIHFLEEREEEMLSKRLLKLSRLNKVRSALELFDSMRILGLQLNAHACNSFLSCLLRNGNLQKVFIVFKYMRTKENVTHTYSLLLKAVTEVKGCDSALRMFRELEKDPKHKSYLDVILYNTVIYLWTDK